MKMLLDWFYIREMAEEQQRRIEAEVALERQKTRFSLLSISLVFVTSLAILVLVALKENQIIDDKFAKSQFHERIKMHINLSKTHLKERAKLETELALIEMLKAGTLVLLPLELGHSPKIEDTDTDKGILKNLIKDMKDIINEIENKKKPGESNDYSLFEGKDLNKLDLDELHSALKNVYNRGCGNLSEKALDEFKEKELKAAKEENNFAIWLCSSEFTKS